MAPLASDPRQVLLVMNLARRKALYTLVEEITAWMRSQLELKSAGPNVDNSAPLFALDQPSSGSTSGASSGKDQPDISISQKITPPSPELIRLRKDATAHLDAWRKEVLAKLRELLSTPDDAKILEARQKRTAKMAQRKIQQPAPGESLIDFGGDDATGDAEAAAKRAADVARLQALYHPIPTRLTTIAIEDREEALSCVLLLLLSSGRYDAHARVLVLYLASALGLPLAVVSREEIEIARSLVEASTSDEAKKQAQMSADAEAEKRRQDGQTGRFWKVGLASVAGAAIIGVTGGLAAPVVAGAIGSLMTTVGLGGVASFLGIFWMNGALVGALFGAYGAKMTGEMVDRYAKEVEDFKFLPLKEEWGKEYSKDGKDSRRLRVTIGINGWLTTKDEVTRPWRPMGDDSEVFALRYEMNSLLALGQSLMNLVRSAAWGLLKMEILKRTVLVTLWSALWPAWVIKEVASGIDNPFNLARNRSEKAGRILADALINKVQGERPVTLVGYSLGARVIYSCLRSLAQRRAFGLVDEVVLIGAPVPSNREHWLVLRSVVSGKLFNVYSENDYILAFLYRTTSIQLGVAGLQAVRDIEGVENLDLSADVNGHLRYPDLVGKILTRCGFPDIKGGEGPIEKEVDDGIRLQDADKSRTGTLIDLGGLSLDDKPVELSAPVLPKRQTMSIPPQRAMEVPKDRMVVTRAKSESMASDHDPLSATGEKHLNRPSQSSHHTASLNMTAAKSAISLDESRTQPVSGPPTVGANTPFSEPSVASGKAKEPSLPQGHGTPSTTALPERYHVNEDDEDEEDDAGWGIQMVNHDEDELAFAEPVPIED